MSGIGGEIIIIFFLILASGIFAMAEMAVITARKSRLEEWVKKGRRRAGMRLGACPNAEPISLDGPNRDHFRRHPGGGICREKHRGLDGDADPVGCPMIGDVSQRNRSRTRGPHDYLSGACHRRACAQAPGAALPGKDRDGARHPAAALHPSCARRWSAC